MSEPARSLPPLEAGSRAAPGPLRDWLAAMKAHAPVEAAPAPEAKAVRPVEAGWSPRIVPQTEAPAAVAEDPDVAELMAENLMLKAKIHGEAERERVMQLVLAEQIRELRQHVEEEVGSLRDLQAEQEAVRAEREQFKIERERFLAEREAFRAERDRAVTERDALRAECEGLAAERDGLGEDRDLWRARAEALAQPLFQNVRR